MPPTSEVLSTAPRAERKVSVRYFDINGRQREEQMPFAEFQAFCIAWYAEQINSRSSEDRKSLLVRTAAMR